MTTPTNPTAKRRTTVEPRAEFGWDDPTSDVVLLDGGPLPLRGFHYRDWLAVRASSRHLRVALDRPDAWERCYAPTTEVRTDDHGRSVRVWRHVPVGQWRRWGAEYLTPEERAALDLDQADRRAVA